MTINTLPRVSGVNKVVCSVSLAVQYMTPMNDSKSVLVICYR